MRVDNISTSLESSTPGQLYSTPTLHGVGDFSLRHLFGTKFREGTLGIIGAIGENQGPLQVVRLENTTDAGLESEAAREAESAVATRSCWVEVSVS